MRHVQCPPRRRAPLKAAPAACRLQRLPPAAFLALGAVLVMLPVVDGGLIPRRRLSSCGPGGVVIFAAVGSRAMANFLVARPEEQRSPFVTEIVVLSDIGFQKFGHKCDGTVWCGGTPETMGDTTMTSTHHLRNGRGGSAGEAAATLGQVGTLVQMGTIRGFGLQELMPVTSFMQTEFEEMESKEQPSKMNGSAALDQASASDGIVTSSLLASAQAEGADSATGAEAWALALSGNGDQPNNNKGDSPATPSKSWDQLLPTPNPTPGAAGADLFHVEVRDDTMDALGHASVLQGAGDAQPDPNFFAEHAGVLYVIVGAAVILSLISTCIIFAAGVAMISPPPAGAAAAASTECPTPPGGAGGAPAAAGDMTAIGGTTSSSPERARVEALAVCEAHEYIESRLPSGGGYDCAFSRPRSSKELVRLVGHVEVSSVGAAVLTSPLTRQDCVIFSAVVSRHLHAGVPPVPVAFASSSVAFAVVLGDDPQKTKVHVEVEGDDVSLFDMCSGRHAARQAFARSPDHWQDFVLTHRAASAGSEFRASSSLRADSSHLEFQECALVVGARVTLVGELHRSADGTLSLRPWQGKSSSHAAATAAADMSSEAMSMAAERGEAHIQSDAAASAPTENWRTSWERADYTDMVTSTGSNGAGSTEKVLVSDDPSLLISVNSLDTPQLPPSMQSLPAEKPASPGISPSQTVADATAAVAASSVASRLLQQPLLAACVSLFRRPFSAVASAPGAAGTSAGVTAAVGSSEQLVL